MAWALSRVTCFFVITSLRHSNSFKNIHSLYVMLVSKIKTEFIFFLTSPTFKLKSVGKQLQKALHVVRITLSISELALKLLAWYVPAARHHTTRTYKFLDSVEVKLHTGTGTKGYERKDLPSKIRQPVQPKQSDRLRRYFFFCHTARFTSQNA